MSRFPALSAAGQQVPASIFAKLREHLARFPGDVIPLQIGDTHLAPPAHLHDVMWTELHPRDLYAYGDPAGWPPLIEAITRKATGFEGELAVQVACGATHALSCAVQTLCDPGEEMILLTPHWPLIKGMSIGHGVVPVEVLWQPNLAEMIASPGSAGARSNANALRSSIERAITPRTSAIYVATPNNPDGAMLSAADIAAIAEVAQRHQLWILADEVYEHYAYDAQHVPVASHPVAFPRTVTVFSFAKSFAQAGLRVGYLLAPPAVAGAIKKLVNHSVYNVPVAMQRAALAAMTSGEQFLVDARARYKAARDRAVAKLIAPAAVPPGGAYLWVDFSRWSGADCLPVLERMAERGVLLAPGSAFGDACHAFARLCFTGVDEARLDEGIDRINAVLEHWT